jgi:hypothetical protein
MIIDKSLAGYVMVFEKISADYHAHVPDFPALSLRAGTPEQTQKLMRKALVMHLTARHRVRLLCLPLPWRVEDGLQFVSF